MTNRIAAIVILLIAALVALDVWQGWGASVFLGSKLLILIDTLAVWR